MGDPKRPKELGFVSMQQWFFAERLLAALPGRMATLAALLVFLSSAYVADAIADTTMLPLMPSPASRPFLFDRLRPLRTPQRLTTQPVKPLPALLFAAAATTGSTTSSSATTSAKTTDLSKSTSASSSKKTTSSTPLDNGPHSQPRPAIQPIQAIQNRDPIQPRQ